MSWTSGGFSGVNGTAKAVVDGGSPKADIIEVTGFTFEPTTGLDKYGSNKSQGFKRGVTGTRDSKGTVEVKVDKELGPPYWDGDEIDLELHVNNSGADYIAVGAVIVGAPLSVDINDGKTVTLTYNWEGIEPWVGHGILAPTGSSSGN